MTETAANLHAFPGSVSSTRGNAFQRFAWGSLFYTVFVILFGAVVRISGSGAGCGQHWPTCHGEVAHLPRSIETAIELTHRVTSGLSLLLAVGLFVAAFRRFERGHLVRRAALATLVFMVMEALIGAALVLLALVGKNDSLARAGVMAAHLVNTSLLTGAMTITAWSAGKASPPSWRRARASALLFLGMVVGMLVVSTSGAVTALGDTLYPVATSPGATELGAARSLGYEFLQRSRALHPILAIAILAYLSYAISALKTHGHPLARARGDRALGGSDRRGRPEHPPVSAGVDAGHPSGPGDGALDHPGLARRRGAEHGTRGLVPRF